VPAAWLILPLEPGFLGPNRPAAPSRGSSAGRLAAGCQRGRVVAASFVIAERLLRCWSSDKRAEEAEVMIIQRYPRTSTANPEMPNVG
jgi:hypothetical protein